MAARCLRKVIQIKAVDSPNVRLGLMQKARGIRPTNEVLVEGVLTWQEYCDRRLTWDPIRQCVGLDAEFYEGPEIYLFPKEWLDAARKRGRGEDRRDSTRYMGVDSAEGGDCTCWVVIDRGGLIYLFSIKTPDTNVIVQRTFELMQRYGVKAENVIFDRGGGGKPHADRMRAAGANVRTVTFSESVRPELKRSKTLFQERVDVREDQTLYKNRRIEMYWEAAQMMDPAAMPAPGTTRAQLSYGADGKLNVKVDNGFSMPTQCLDARAILGRKSLFEQLAIIPKEYDKDGRPYLRPKDRNPGQDEQAHKTLKELIGHSPDEADAFVLAVHGMQHKPKLAHAGVPR